MFGSQVQESCQVYLFYSASKSKWCIGKDLCDATFAESESTEELQPPLSMDVNGFYQLKLVVELLQDQSRKKLYQIIVYFDTYMIIS